MYPYIHLIVPSYATLALLGGFVAVCYVYLKNNNCLLFTDLLKVFLCGTLGLVIGSKSLFIITQIPWLVNNFSIKNSFLLIVQSGYVFYGGLFGFVFAIYIISRGDLEYRRKMFRLITPAIPLFHIFGRVGCFLTGCCYGKLLKKSFYIFNAEIDRIPVQLIEALLELIIFIILAVVGKKKKDVDLLAVYLIVYAIIRFVLEFFRGDSVRGVIMGISTSQCISILIVLFYSIRKCFHSKNKELV